MNRHIVSLNRALARTGQDVILRRVIGATNQVSVDCPCRAFVRGYQPEQLAGSIVQGDSRVTISPTDLDRGQWPGGQPITSPPSETDPRVPRGGGADRIIIEGKSRTVISADPIYVAGELVRIDVQVRG